VITRTAALLLRKVEYRESDLLLSLFSESLGKVTTVARSARRSRTRFGGSLEAMHTMEVELAPSRTSDRLELRASRIERPRLNLTSNLERMQAAAKVLSWVRDAAPERLPEPELYRVLSACLDALDTPQLEQTPQSVLALSGLSLLNALGWGLEFSACIRCGAECPAGKAAYLSPSRGGIVCSKCGGGDVLLDAALRTTLERALQDPSLQLTDEDGQRVLRIVEQTLAAHANVGRSG
jgi:DNA repair protein RecO (recombination protein O)